jgi:uncharacterized protein (DUF849 family)
VRIGLEDTLVFRDGSSAANNAALVSALRAMTIAAGRLVQSATPFPLSASPSA